MLPAEINAVTLVEPAKAFSADSQLASIINRMVKLETRLSRSASRMSQDHQEEPFEIAVGELIVADTIDALTIKLSVHNLAAGNR